MRTILIILLIAISFTCYSQAKSITNLRQNGKLLVTKTINIDVFIIAGQSNAKGSGTMNEVAPENYVTNYPYAMMFTKEKPYLSWFDYRSYIFSCCPILTNTFSVEYPLGLKYKTLTHKVIFVKFAVNGTQLYQDAGVTDWNVNSVGEYYDSLKTTIDLFEAYALQFGYKYNYKGFIWLQGEADAAALVKANAYQQNQIDIIDSLRSYVNVPNLPIYTAQIYPSWTYSTTVNNAKINIANSKENVDIVGYKNIEYKADSIHMKTIGVFQIADSIYLQILRNNY